MTKIAEMLQELDMEHGVTRRVLERVKEDQLRFRPHPRSMSMSVLAMHVATLPGALAHVAMTDGFDVTTPIPRPEAASVAHLVETLDESVAEAHRLLGALSDEQLHEPWRMIAGGREIATMPRGVFIRSVMLNHWYHHRGQLSVYLRMTGAEVPAIYGASADENPLAPQETVA